MARSMCVGKGNTAEIVARRLSFKDNILYAQESGYPVYCVDQDANGLKDGSSWEDAFRTIQPAIDLAARNEGWVWVAEGIYENTFWGLDRSRTYYIGAIRLKPKVMLFGGFAGYETTLDQRDPDNNLTVIKSTSGMTNCRGVYIDHRTLIDGFTIRDSGYFNYRGGGTDDYMAGSGIKTGNWLAIIHNNRIHGNYGKSGGGIAIYNRDNAYNVEKYSPIVDKNMIYGNYGLCGSGAQIRYCEALFSQNVVVFNTIDNTIKQKGFEIIAKPEKGDPPVIVNTIAWANSRGQSSHFDIYNDKAFVELYGDAARAYSWNKCIEKYRTIDNHHNLIRSDPVFTNAG